MITVSLVSHGQGDLATLLLKDLGQHCAKNTLQILLTLNIDEQLPREISAMPLDIRIIRNPEPKGFGENHNAAFRLASGSYFCVINPDIRIHNDPFPHLMAALRDGADVAAPVVMGPNGEIEDSARRFPTPLGILQKLLFRLRDPDYLIEPGKQIEPDWVAGMFMLWRPDAFLKLAGFDEKYFLYYEDVDICYRLREGSGKVVLVSDAAVTHHARRTSHRNPRYLRWHICSMLRYFRKTFVRRVLSGLKY